MKYIRVAVKYNSNNCIDCFFSDSRRGCNISKIPVNEYVIIRNNIGTCWDSKGKRGYTYIYKRLLNLNSNSKTI